VCSVLWHVGLSIWTLAAQSSQPQRPQGSSGSWKEKLPAAETEPGHVHLTHHVCVAQPEADLAAGADAWHQNHNHNSITRYILRGVVAPPQHAMHKCCSSRPLAACSSPMPQPIAVEPVASWRVHAGDMVAWGGLLWKTQLGVEPSSLQYVPVVWGWCHVAASNLLPARQ
jgi:hypothetical protein